MRRSRGRGVHRRPRENVRARWRATPTRAILAIVSALRADVTSDAEPCLRPIRSNGTDTKKHSPRLGSLWATREPPGKLTLPLQMRPT
eukprot:5018276-Pyramimonas_sp.AAC.1